MQKVYLEGLRVGRDEVSSQVSRVIYIYIFLKTI